MLCFMYVMRWTHICEDDYGQILGSLSNDDGEGNENGKKTATTSNVHLAFLYIS